MFSELFTTRHFFQAFKLYVQFFFSTSSIETETTPYYIALSFHFRSKVDTKPFSHVPFK